MASNTPTVHQPSVSPLEKWEFEIRPQRWDISADSSELTDVDRRQWRSRLPLYLVADHLTAEESFRATVHRVRASDDGARAAWTEAHCFSPRAGDKGGRRALMATLLQIAASAEPGCEERALQSLVLSAWTPGEMEGRSAVTRLQERYVARLWIGARVLACRSAGRCVRCDIVNKQEVRTHAGDYCRHHTSDVDHPRLTPGEREWRMTLRQDKARHRKAAEHLFGELRAVVPPPSVP